MRGSVLSITERETAGKWSRCLPSMGVTKVGLYDKSSLDKRPDFLSGLISSFDYVYDDGRSREVPFDLSYVTYLGFGVHPIGLLFRDAGPAKDFRIADFGVKKLAFYVSQRFEERIQDFRYGMPIVMAEGLLDVEAFAYMVGYPFVVGYLTSYVPAILAAVMASLTDNILLVPDNDESGKDNVHRSVENFNIFGTNVQSHVPVRKDFGDVFAFGDTLDVARAKAVLRQNWSLNY